MKEYKFSLHLTEHVWNGVGKYRKRVSINRSATSSVMPFRTNDRNYLETRDKLIEKAKEVKRREAELQAKFDAAENKNCSKLPPLSPIKAAKRLPNQFQEQANVMRTSSETSYPVSYTHLTLPTICSV